MKVGLLHPGAGLPDGFALAATDVYRRLARLKDAQPSLDEVIASLTEVRGPGVA